MKLKLYKGRPENTDGRLEKEIKVYDLLDALNIKYERIDHTPVMTMEACEEIDKALEAPICKNLFLCNRQKTDFYLLMIPSGKSFHTKELSAQIGSARLSFADEVFLEKYMNLTSGSVSIMGLINDTKNHVRLLVDEDILKSEYLGCHPCVNTSSLKIRTADVFDIFLKEIHHDKTIVHLSS